MQSLESELVSSLASALVRFGLSVSVRVSGCGHRPTCVGERCRDLQDYRIETVGNITGRIAGPQVQSCAPGAGCRDVGRASSARRTAERTRGVPEETWGGGAGPDRLRTPKSVKGGCASFCKPCSGPTCREPTSLVRPCQPTSPGRPYRIPTNSGRPGPENRRNKHEPGQSSTGSPQRRVVVRRETVAPRRRGPHLAGKGGASPATEELRRKAPGVTPPTAPPAPSSWLPGPPSPPRCP